MQLAQPAARCPSHMTRILTWLTAASSFACAAPMAPRPVDRDLQQRVDRLLGPASSDLDAFRNDDLLYPELASEVSDPQAADQDAPVVSRPMGLGECLAAAFETNRDFISQREGLVLAALSLIGARNTFDPQLSALLATSLGDTDSSDSSQSVGASASLSQILRDGGVLTLDGRAGWDGVDGDGDYDASASLRLVQPLLRGFGWLSSHESLIQAERTMIYAIRAYELFREDLSIEVAARYYSLVQQQQSIANLETNLKGFIFARRQAQAIYALGTTSELDILRARRNELGAENTLLEARENYQLDRDQLKVFLGISIDEVVTITGQEPEFVEVQFDLDSALDVALSNRLDYLTRRDLLVDLERDVRLARDGLRSDLDLRAGVGVTSNPTSSLTRQQVDEESWDVGLTWSLPLNRVSEKNAHRVAQIRYDRAVRDLDQFEQNLRIEIRRTFRELKRRTASLKIQRELIADQERNLKVAQLRNEAGEISNRDVVEASESLLEARNSLITEKVSYEIARLRLLRQLGILFVDERGMVQG
ncbi:MAG: outer membrane protein TolC [Gammaproteobacteria bacterium]